MAGLNAADLKWLGEAPPQPSPLDIPAPKDTAENIAQQATQAIDKLGTHSVNIALKPKGVGPLNPTPQPTSEPVIKNPPSFMERVAGRQKAGAVLPAAILAQGLTDLGNKTGSTLNLGELIPQTKADIATGAVTGGIGGRLGALKRPLAAGLMQGAMALPQGPLAALKAAGTGVLGQGIGEVGVGVPGAVGRQIKGQKILGEVTAGREAAKDLFQRAKADYPNVLAQAKATHAGKQIAEDTALTAAKATHETERKAAVEKGVAHIMAAWEPKVPAWKGTPHTVEGLRDWVHGNGPEKLSASFDAAMQKAKKDAQGVAISIPKEVAEEFGITFKPLKPGEGKPGQISGARGAPITQVFVDAAEAIARVTGQWKKHPGEYRVVANALVKAGVGNEEARAEYKAGQALIEGVKKSGMMPGAEFLPSEKGLNKAAPALRSRDMGNAVSGPLAEGTRMGIIPPFEPPQGPPLPPFQPPPRPVMGPTPQLPEGMSAHQVGLPAYALGLPLAAGMYMGHHPPYLAAEALGLPLAMYLKNKQLVTGTPLSPAMEAIMRSGASVLGPGAIRWGQST